MAKKSFTKTGRRVKSNVSLPAEPDNSLKQTNKTNSAAFEKAGLLRKCVTKFLLFNSDTEGDDVSGLSAQEEDEDSAQRLLC